MCKVDWQALFVDDDEVFCRQVKEFLEEEKFLDRRLQVTTLNDFSEALVKIGKHRFDLIILDVRLGSHEISKKSKEEAGIQTFHAIRERSFLPIVFYTGLPNQVGHLVSPVVRVVEKSAGFDRLRDTVKDIFETRLPDISRAIIRHLEKVQREYMWEFVANYWEQLTSGSDRTTLAYLLIRRLSLSLSLTGVNELAVDLGASTTVSEDKVHPVQYYVMPPLWKEKIFAGDLFKGQIGKYNSHWVLLTPTCDIWSKKADELLLAFCVSLDEVEQYRKWVASQSNKTQEKLKTLLGDRGPERYFFLPGVFSFPDLVVDFQHLVTLPREKINTLERLASLDTPFASKLLARFIRYYGRHGAPDLDVDIMLARLQEGIAQAEVASTEEK